MKIHIVKKGDTLYALSQKYGVTLQKIIEANPQISNPEVLAIGDKVKIPAAPMLVPENNELYYKHTVKQGDTLWKLSKAWGITLKEIIDANPHLKNPNALMTGEVVNIPKKANEPTPIQAQSVQPMQSNANANANATPVQPLAVSPEVVDKTKVGGKTYTGPKEEPVQAVSPVSTPAPNPAPAPVQVAAPLPNKAPEVAPVQEVVHETQSLFVQISVPAQEAITYEMPKEKEKSEVQPATWPDHKDGLCEKTAGYPGLNENPYYFDCPPAYSYYEQPMPVMGMNAAPGFIQPTVYMPDCASPYDYPGNMYPATDYSNAWYPNAAPEYVNAAMAENNPPVDYSAYAVPQYGGQSMNLPWPTCGCGGGMPIQPYTYEQPAYNNMPPNNMPPYMPQPGTVSPYGAGPYSMPNEAAVAPLGIHGIPGYPMYPGMENYAHHNRVPEILEPEVIAQDVPQAAEGVSTGTAVKNKASSGKAGTPKVKTSGLAADKSNKTAPKQRSKQSGRTGTSKKSKNPWISN